MQQLLSTDELPGGLLSALSGREVTLWLHRLPTELDSGELTNFIGLPWRDVMLGESTKELLDTLSSNANADLVRRRGYLQLIQTDPSLLAPLPPRSLPVYLLDAQRPSESEFDRTLRRMAMLGALRRSGVRHLLIVSDEDSALPAEFASLFDAAFQPFVTFVSVTAAGLATALAWTEGKSAGRPVQLVRLAPVEFIRALVARYAHIYPADSAIVRLRRADGSTTLVDLTEADDVERPILNAYELIQERDLAIVAPEELDEEEFVGFFEGRQDSWRPYAAGVPWLRNDDASRAFKQMLRKLDTVGSPENKIAYIASQSGAGGTTLARSVAFEAARAGYPTLVAKPVPFIVDALPIAGYLTRAHQAFLAAEESRSTKLDTRRLYESPWVIVFDRVHFDHREGDLRHFVNELTRSGRPVLVLAVIGSIKPIEFYSDLAREIAAPTHFLDDKEVDGLGRHMNRFLRVYQKARPLETWSQFYHEHRVQRMYSVAAFWIALSFWVRMSRDITGSIQDWVYNTFIAHARTKAMQCALLEIAALSSERLPMDERLLPPSDDEWPLSVRLEDQRHDFSALGLMRVKADGDYYWGLAHDILGRLLLNAVFQNFALRSELDLGEARDPEHLRFLVLKRIAVKPAMAELRHRPLAEQYAKSIFKIDPDHGAHAFATIWREVLAALDDMPKLLRDTSRIFRHHTAISRRRIATFENPLYQVTVRDRVELLERAIADIKYAIASIERVAGDEPDINLNNSLANAYLNLADVIATTEATRERAAELRQLANEATRRAYSDNPTNPWVVETHIRNLLSIAKSESGRTADAALEALLAVYDALRTSDANLRTDKLGRLGEDALTLLLANTPPGTDRVELATPVDILLAAWRILARGGATGLNETLTDLPPDLAEEALAVLSDPVGKGDMQVLRFQYGILSAARPFEFSTRLTLIENLQATDLRLSPQLKLEYALLLYQVGRGAEGDQRFRDLRRLWRDGEHFVQVPEPLNWLREGESEALRTVQAFVGSEQGFRPMARVSEFRNITAPFRPEEFAVRNMRPGTAFRAHVSFGHNGPFLRPPSAGPRRG
ncbi:MAG TPA: hypothetical protein DDZ81_08415 [Acetobacteraceae bacterium]|jgi:hypothetical protein|nr:hypothetical protein [Acetobacteraceae bacterium]